MTAADRYALPLALRSARYVPRQAPGRRGPLRVTASAFRARGLEVPEDRARWNVYQLSERQGFPWSPQIDYHVHRRGAELLGRSEFLCIDLDQHLTVDGSVWLDGLRWLTDTGMATGNLLDIATFVTVRTPGTLTEGTGGAGISGAGPILITRYGQDRWPGAPRLRSSPGALRRARRGTRYATLPANCPPSPGGSPSWPCGRGPWP
jgi:hypothetical protein